MAKSTCYCCQEFDENYHFIEVDTLMMRTIDDIMSLSVPEYHPVCPTCAEELHVGGILVGLLEWLTDS